MSGPIREARHQDHHHHILYDPDLVPDPSVSLFEPQHWAARDELTAADAGRGSAWFIGPAAQPWVLRHYRRGGLPGKLIRDHYWHNSNALSRPWREFRISARLFSQGLPVPRPVAACLTRHGLTDTGALITCRIPKARSLGDRLCDGDMDEAAWQAVGTVVGQFHAEQVWHADLNVANLLCEAQDHWHLIDLDRARIRAGRYWAAGNLKRLRRSVDKLLANNPQAALSAQRWTTMLDAYRAAVA